jgi:UDP-N-acetylmuramyl pentapeptide phosphotransferase/UDP-N-acetylglucosamine-1-phosphate transferase
VLKWLLTLVIALLVMGAMTPWLRRLGFGRMPGDITIERDGRQYSFPIGSTIILSLLASLIFWMLR